VFSRVPGAGPTYVMCVCAVCSAPYRLPGLVACLSLSPSHPLPTRLPTRPPFHSQGDALPAAADIDAAAQRCNARKAQAKKAQDASSRLFLFLMLAGAPQCMPAHVLGVGPGSFTLGVTAIGHEARLHADKCKDQTATAQASLLPRPPSTGRSRVRWSRAC